MAVTQSTSTCRTPGCVGLEYRCKRCLLAFTSRHSHGRRPEYCSRACREPAPPRKEREPITEQRCSICGFVKPVRDFTARSDRPGRYHSRCKSCTSVYSQSYYLRNQQKIIDHGKSWYAQNRERAIARGAAYRISHPEKEQTRKLARRIRKATNRIPFTSVQLAARLAMFSGCWMCGEAADTVDHVKPLARGGAHMLANLRPACRACNGRKSARWFGASELSSFILR